MLKGKILTLTETLNNTELETKASRETIMRLVSEVGKEQKDYEKSVMEMDALRSVRDLVFPETMCEPSVLQSSDVVFNVLNVSFTDTNFQFLLCSIPFTVFTLNLDIKTFYQI